MTQKQAAYLALSIIALLGVGYLFQTYLIAERLPADRLDPVHFPAALGVALVALCLIEIVREFRRIPEPQELRLTLPNAGKLGITIGLTGAYFFFWGSFGLFYPLTFAFFLGLLVTYQRDRSMRSLALMAAISAASSSSYFSYSSFPSVFAWDEALP
jgi:hypothetical protein